MGFYNRFANPVVRAVLRSPLHGLASRWLLLLTYTGRRTGRRYTLPAQYVRRGDELFLFPGRAARKTWWRNLRGRASVSVRLRGRDLAATAVVVSDEEEVLAALRAYLDRFPATARVLGIGGRPTGAVDESSLRRAAADAVIVRLRLEGRERGR
jgi:deazaflavin-dependent oxidoreductase (nitroreductase family)